jgi:methylmalonyl-CoA mutase cobalamin-binding subunit
MGAAVIRRGHVSTQQTIRVAVDSGQVAAAVVSSVDAAFTELHGLVGFELHPHAVVDAQVGVTRAFLRSPWHWGLRTLASVLIFATLRG